MNFKFIATAIIVGVLTKPEPTVAKEEEQCDTPGEAKGQCTQLSIDYDIHANYRISTTYTNCKTGKPTTRTSDYLDCSNHSRSDKYHDWGTYIYKDVLVGSELKMGPKWTYTDNYNVNNVKAKEGDNKFLCSGSIGTSSAKCEPE